MSLDKFLDLFLQFLGIGCHLDFMVDFVHLTKDDILLLKLRSSYSGSGHH